MNFTNDELRVLTEALNMYFDTKKRESLSLAEMINRLGIKDKCDKNLGQYVLDDAARAAVLMERINKINNG